MGPPPAVVSSYDAIVSPVRGLRPDELTKHEWYWRSSQAALIVNADWCGLDDFKALTLVGCHWRSMPSELSRDVATPSKGSIMDPRSRPPVSGGGSLPKARCSRTSALLLLCSCRPCLSLFLPGRARRAYSWAAGPPGRRFRPRSFDPPRSPVGEMERSSSGEAAGTNDLVGRDEEGTAPEEDVAPLHLEPQQEQQSPPPPRQPSSPPLYHHWAVCVVPPPSPASRPVWEAITEARTRLHDPGLYRWPPHVNLLYPFLDCYQRAARNNVDGDHHDDAKQQEAENCHDGSNRGFRQDVLDKLRRACERVEPFAVQLRRLGTFGGARRGVLWLDPHCVDYAANDQASKEDCGNSNGAGSGEESNADGRTADTESPAAPSSSLVRLQRLLEDEFPSCTAQRTAGGDGRYRPHMTLSHFANLDAALQARSETEERWSQLPSPETDFVVDRIYVLTRRGDGGQFERAAEVRLGRADKEGEAAMTRSFEPENGAGRFPDMPAAEYDWVREQRMALKKRRNNHKGRRRPRGQRGTDGRSEERRSPARADLS